MMPPSKDQSQLDKFKEAARDLETDDDPERFKKRLGKLVRHAPIKISDTGGLEAEADAMGARALKHKPVQETKMVITFYLTSATHLVPDFQDRREMDRLPAVDETVSISGDEAGKTIEVVIRANSDSKPELAGVLRDKGAWAICQRK